MSPMQAPARGNAASAAGCRHPYKTMNLCGNCPRRNQAGAPSQSQAAAELAKRAAARRAEKAMASGDAALSGALAVREPSAVVRQMIDGDKILRYVYTFLKRFAVWNSEAEIVTATLWIAMTHARDGDGVPVWQYCARLGILGPSGSGKSWKSRLVGKLSSNGKILVEPTKPSFIDLCADNNTVIITEADEAFRSPSRSRGILAVVNAAYEPDRSTSRKQGGVAVEIPLYCHVVLDGIDSVLLSPNRPDLGAMLSRTICILSRRAKDGYRPPRFDSQARALADEVALRASAWMAQEVQLGLAGVVPVVPEDLGNRPFALWEPLFAVAWAADRAWREEREAAGEDVAADAGPWSQACRAACQELEAAGSVPTPQEDTETELDRQMAAWGQEF